MKAVSQLIVVFGVSIILGAAQLIPSPEELFRTFFNETPTGASQGLPSPVEFLQTLFNETGAEVLTMAKNFYFREVKPSHIKFYVFYENGTYLSTDFKGHHAINVSQPVKIIIHGWQSQGDRDFIKDLANSYFKIGINNIIGVDWQEHSKKNYIHAASSTMNVGKVVAHFIINLIKQDLKLLKNIHLIGHSLGAQISGFAGKEVKKEINAKVGRITALDAAAPIFEFPIKMPAEFRVSSGDADYVDGIHTNAGFLGFFGPFATADYYIDNGGPVQPECLEENFLESFFCSHSKSHDIFNKSITSKSFKATPCPNVALYRTRLCLSNEKVIMGEHASTKARGTFFFDDF